MPIESWLKGNSGEHLADAVLSRYFVLAAPKPDLGIDRYGHFIDAVGTELVWFGFQVKAGRRFHAVASRTVRRWINGLEREPVVLIHIDPREATQFGFSFLVLHDWLLRHPDWPEVIVRQESIQFPMGEFQLIAPDAANFVTSMREEAARVRKAPGALWRVLRTVSLPISEVELFERFGVLNGYEVSATSLESVRKECRPLTNDDLWELMRQVAGRDPIWSPDESRLMAAIAHDRQAFREFYSAMRSCRDGESFRMPSCTWADVNAWRAFTAIFPEAITLIETVFKNPQRWSADELSASFLLTSSLANHDDGQLSTRASALLREPEDFVASRSASSPAHYALGHIYWYTRAEAEPSRRTKEQCIDFIARNGRGPELPANRVNRDYYQGGDAITREAVGNKIAHPKPRDLGTRAINELLVEMLPHSLN